MSQLNFPTNPSLGDIWVIGAVTWQWNGYAWVKVTTLQQGVSITTITNILSITTGTASTSTITGALVVRGGVGIGGNLYVGTVYSNGSEVITTSTLGSSGVTRITAGIGISVNSSTGNITVTNIGVQTISAGTDTRVSSSTGTVTVWNDSTLQTVTSRGATTNNAISITNTTAATGTTTGALTITGGVGIGGDLYVGTVYSNGQQVVTSTSSNTSFVSAIVAGTDTRVSTSTGVVTVWNDSTLQTITSRGATSNVAVSITNTTAASSTNSGALQVVGGVGIGENLYVGGTLTADGNVTFTSTTTAATAGGGSGALKLSGGAYIGDNLIVNSLAFNTSTNTSNALYVNGGAWIDKGLIVDGPTTFNDIVIFNGTSTFVLSTNTVYTDNLLNLHIHEGGVASQWTFDDGKDIGLIFHYYKGEDKNGFIGLANDSGYLEWYNDGVESVGGIFTGTSYGTFKTGNIELVGLTNAVSTVSGALQVAGGVGVGLDVYAGGTVSGGTVTARNLTNTRLVIAGASGQLTDDTDLTWNAGANQIEGRTAYANTATLATKADNLVGGQAGGLPYQTTTDTTTFLSIGTNGYVLQSNGTAPVWGPLSGIVAGAAATATNIANGLKDQIPYQSDVGATTFSNDLIFNGTTFTTTNVVLTSQTNSTGTLTGALVVTGGVGIGKDLYVGGLIYSNGNPVGAVIADDTTTNATYYPVLSSINTGTLTTASVSSTKLTFNPSTGQLTSVDLNSSSDRDLKENITTIDNAIETIQQLRGVRFSWKDSGQPSYGLIAQELELILPELVAKDGENYKTVRYLPIIGFLVEAVKDLQQQIIELKQQR
jgi:hypothetical protein